LLHCVPLYCIRLHKQAESVTLDFDKDGHVASQHDLLGVDLTLFSDDCSGRTLATPFVVVESRCLQQAPLLSVAAAVEDTPSETDGRGGNTGPCSSGAGDVMLLALDMSGRIVDDSRRAEDSPPVMKFSSLSTHAS